MLELDEATVHDTVDTLIKKRHVIEKNGFGSRVTKYQHRFCNTEFGSLKFSEQELAIVCVLLVRGPQTPGELRTRSERLCKFEDVREVESTLAQLIRRDDGPFVTQLPREPGNHETRYFHLFGGEPERRAPAATVDKAPTETDTKRLDHLEQTVSQLRDELATLQARLDQISPD